MGVKVALDSDMLRNLTDFCRLSKDGTSYKCSTTLNNKHIQQNHEGYVYLFNYIKKRKIELCVCPTVFSEISHLEGVVEFVKKYCTRTFPDIEKVEKLAKAYSSPYTHKGETFYQPMERIFVSAIDKYVPSNDCYIMACATLDNCCLLTNNLADYVFDNHSGDINNHRRADGIRVINSKFGFKKMINDHVHFIPQPISFTKLIKQLEKKQYKTISYEQNNNDIEDLDIL